MFAINLLLTFVSSAIALGQAATGGSFSFLTLNVAGLPQILQNNEVPGDKTDNTARIGQKFAAYNFSVIHVQEDFNYHATLYANDDHLYRTATSGGVPFGSGLNTISNYDWVDFTRIKWATCSDASSNDCLTPKGFTLMRVQFGEGVYIDFYNVHADAGIEAGDETARTANIQQVADYINTWSVGNAVVVAGDTNSRYTRADDNIRVFETLNNLTDAWVQLERDGVDPAQGSIDLLCDNPSLNNSCETVDKVLYRGSDAIDLTATSFTYDSTNFLQANGSILSDHNPVLVEFAWTLSNNFRQSNLWGGPHGTWFNDLPSIPASAKVSNINIRGGARLDGVALTLTSGATFSHGGTGGSPVSLTLADDEYWTQAQICEAQYNGDTRIFNIRITTSAGNTLTAGTATSDCYTAVAPN
ncbi:MAG: hypothetical protein M1820_001730 [Bogoriella megaspora]|nr:MAG: hypothetical protein M1820_001730 [Bogoriella megaspora]